jgi:apolipoprotein N-acyltransferase
MTLIADRKETRLTKSPSASASPLPAAQAAKAASPCAVPAIVTGALLWACHFPLAWGWLSWFALVPLLTLTRAQAPSRRIYWAAYLSGLVFFVPALQWMRVADARMYATWLMLAFYCAAYFPLGLWLIRMLDRRVGMPLCVSVPLVWVGLEWVRSFMLTGFAWFYLAHAQHQFTSLIQIADLGGVYAVSFLVAAVNGWLCEVAFQIPALRDRFRWREMTLGKASQANHSALGVWLHGATLAALIVAAVLYGTWRLEQDNFAPGPRIALLQTNVPQSVRNGTDAKYQMIMQNTALPYFACMTEPLPELIVWPETSYLGRFIDVARELPIERVDRETLEDAESIRRRLVDPLTLAFPTRHLLGINTLRLDGLGQETRYSSALLVQDDGAPSHRFDKIHRVPFGEYVPFRDWLPFMKVFAPYGPDNDYSIAPGKMMTRFPLRDFHFGALVCYEDSDAALARQYAQKTADGKPVDFLVNLSNDGWFQGTSEHEEHLVVSLFRAIENRRALVRSVNMGISAVIDPNGRILKPQLMQTEPPDPDRLSANPKVARAQKSWEAINLWANIKKWEKERPSEAIKVWEVLPNRHGKMDELAPSEYAQYKQGAGVLFATVPIDARTSFYSQWGDWLPIGCWGLCLAALAWAVRRDRKGLATASL